MKKCYRCSEEKPLDSFPFERSKGKHGSWCKQCGLEYRMGRQRALFEEIANYKVDKGCEICGYNKHRAGLHFDHIDPSTKHMAISTMISRMKSKELIYKEI